MNPILNAAPMFNFGGLKDDSGRTLVPEAVQVPTHYPHVYIYAPRGGAEPVSCAGDTVASVFGSEAVDPRSKYYTHQSKLLTTLLGRGNQVLVQRIIPADAPSPARLLLCADIVEEQIQQYERNADGTYRLTAEGDRIPVENSKLAGHTIRWSVVNPMAEATEQVPAPGFGASAPRVGALVNSVSEQSTRYPIMELEVSHQGEYGNNYGIRIDVPHAMSSQPADEYLTNAIRARLMNVQIITRKDAYSSASIVASMGGENSLLLTLAPDRANPMTTARLSMDEVFLDAYRRIDQPGWPDIHGPFGRMHIYRQNLEAILEMIGATEAPRGTINESVTITADDLYLVNPFTGFAVSGAPYYTLEVQGPMQGGIAFSANANMWASGGGDGTMSADAFDAAVRDQFDNYGTNGIDMLDDAKYDISAYYDTGFKLDTKLAMINLLGKRDDIALILSTQEAGRPLNTAADESAIAIALRNALRLHPESVIHGTSVCRGLIVGHGGQLLSDTRKETTALTIEFADKAAWYMGAANGRWRSGAGFDISPNNKINLFTGLNVTFKGASVRNRDWDNGLIWAQRYDASSFFWPATQTVYDDDTSVLNSAITMFGALEAIKTCRRVWRDLTGRSDLTDEQFAERSDRMFDERISGRFDGRFVFTSTTFYTEADTQRGYSWSSRVDMYANNSKTVGTSTIVTRRMSDLNQGS